MPTTFHAFPTAALIVYSRRTQPRRARVIDVQYTQLDRWYHLAQPPLAFDE